METEIQANPADTVELILQLSISRNLERIADLATNIAEDVIYMIDAIACSIRFANRSSENSSAR